MKNPKHWLFALFTLTSFFCSAQRSEFKTYPNGLIYSDTTMAKLKHIVDSLNLKFKDCGLNKTYLSKEQAKAHYVRIDSGDILQAKKDMEAGMGFDELVRKYPMAEVDKELLVLKFQSEIASIIPENEIWIIKGDYENIKSLQGKYLVDYNDIRNNEKESVKAFYLISDFIKQPLPDVYARMIQYSDCVTDTSIQMEVAEMETGPLIINWEIEGLSSTENQSIKEFMSFVENNIDLPKRPDIINNRGDYFVLCAEWDSIRFQQIEVNLSKQNKFLNLLKDAVAEAKIKGGSFDEFEEYVARYYSKKSALDLKKSRSVMTECLDDGPRIHIMNIAILSAETVEWETFLRAHLSFMNDPLDRLIDSSYAWEGRKTYMQELEGLDINLTDLMLGISLRIENPAQNHYYGSIGRLGRALSETKKNEETETKILSALSDPNLDDYNRLLMYYLFGNYNHWLKDEAKKKENEEKLNKAIATLPPYLSERIIEFRKKR